MKTMKLKSKILQQSKAMLHRLIMKSFLADRIEHALYSMRFHKAKSNFKKALLLTKEQQSIQQSIGKFKNSRVLLPLIETAHYKSVQLLLIAKALELRGAKVVVLICGQALGACEIRSVRNESKSNPCWKCKFNEQNILPLFGLQVVTLSEYIRKNGNNNISKNYQDEVLPESVQISIDRCVEDSVIRHYYGNVPSDTYVVSQIRSKYRQTAFLSWKVMQCLHHEFNFNLVLGYMVAYADFAPYFIYSKYSNIPFRLISSTQFDGNAQIFNWPDLHHSDFRFRNYLFKRTSPHLTDRERNVLENFFAKRKQGINPVTEALGLGKNKNIGCVSEHGIEIDTNKRNIFLFSNVHWDIGISDLGSIYNSVIDWVISTIKLVSENQDCHLFIRCHPAERLDAANGTKGIEDFVREEFPLLPSNITIIGSEHIVSSYELFPYIDLGVVSIGTIGLEMLLDHISITVVGKSPYLTLSGVTVPKDIDEYKNILFGKAKVGALSYDEIEVFAYFYFCKTSIPWNLTKTSYSADIFAPLQFDSLEDLLPGKDPYLDHLCDCLVDSSNSPEAW
jgi:hypothetical protein